MLSRQDQRTLANSIVSWEQDAFLRQTFLGEPFLTDGFLSFFDGETLFFFGASLNSTSDYRPILIERIEKLKPVRIDFVGDDHSRLSFLRKKGLHRIHRKSPDKFDVELTLAIANNARFEKRLRETARHKRSGGISCDFRASPLTSQHLHLLKKSAERWSAELGSFDTASLIILPNFLARSKHGVTVDAWAGDRLVGFAQGHTNYLPRLGVFALCVTDTSYKHATDILYAEILNRFRTLGAEQCSLGTGMDAGILRFKEKWGASRMLLRQTQSIWAKPGYTDSAYHWPLELAKHSIGTMPAAT